MQKNDESMLFFVRVVYPLANHKTNALTHSRVVLRRTMACELELVSPSSSEFGEVASLIAQSCPHECIISIDRVRNAFMEERFQRRKSELEMKGPGPVQEYRVFHGSRDIGALRIILENGFDAGKNKTAAYGRGTYFARRFGYSKDFSVKNQDLKALLVCDILVKRCVRGRASAVLDPSEGDCWVDNVKSPTIFSIPNNDQCIPRYLVQFV